MSVFVGVDIAARSFDVVIREDDKGKKPKRYQQTAQGHAKAIQALKKVRPERIVMEATGIYYLDLAVALTEADLPVSVINPKSFRHFAELTLTRTKTDGVDSALLAEYAERMAPKLWTPPEPVCLELRDLGRQINRLTGSRIQAKNRLHALQSKNSTSSLLLEDEQEGIEFLEKRIKRLREAAETLIAEHEALSRHYNNLQQAPGMGKASTLSILAELCVLPDDMKAPQVSRFAGLDVRLTQSGSSVNRPARLNKAGNAYLRAALYMPAMSAVRSNERAKAFYDALVGRGKKKIQAQCAVMRKYLTGIWACMKNETPFDSALLFSDEHFKA
ncbi:IS110 family transposase [Saccharospirillum salsuginis]|uniref:IS110 family transposase n=1 Tax=Saccharospirillum salsuginis TaxID=418750 RepID=A0A918NJX2_9GAMM|nr:transposase [Saccharospirillum salsuginis]GGX76431.1 IS110 family transposase [Saccharospirillum salsuginis]